MNRKGALLISGGILLKLGVSLPSMLLLSGGYAALLITLGISIKYWREKK